MLHSPNPGSSNKMLDANLAHQRHNLEAQMHIALLHRARPAEAQGGTHRAQRRRCRALKVLVNPFQFLIKPDGTPTRA